MLTLNNPGKKPFENIVGKGGNGACQHFLLFPLFSAQSKKKCNILTTLELLSANVLNLDTGPTFFSYGKTPF